VNLEFFDIARDELLEAALYYEAKQPGLGVRFRNEVFHLCELIQSEPLLWREREEGYRRVNCPVFPYFIAYLIEQQTVFIVPWHIAVGIPIIGKGEFKSK